MKRRLISIVSIMVVLGLAWASFGRPESPAESSTASSSSGTSTSGQNRLQQRRESQQKAFAVINEQLAKMKTMMESSLAPRRNWRELPEDERNKLREEYRKRREEQMKALGLIEDQIVMLKGRRSVFQEHDNSIGELNSVLELAKKEKATETAAAVEKLIAQKNKDFETRMKKLGLERPQTRRRSN